MHKLAILREKKTGMREFRSLVSEITLLLAYEATRRLPMVEVEVQTPITRFVGNSLAETEIVVCPILRAGLGMVSGMLGVYPNSRVAHIGLKRDEETKQPQTYYFNFPPDVRRSTVLLVDPMLATAGSLCAAIDLIKKSSPMRIIGLCLIAAPEGKARVEKEHPDVDVYVAALDEKLDENAYIVPGLGDAGDRMFGTY